MPTVVLDCETFVNYFLAAFKNVETGEVIAAELYDDHPLDRDLIRDILENDTTVGFNSINFDLPILAAALAGHSTADLKQIADDIILRGARPYEIEREWGFRIPRNWDHIDLIEVAPLDASLKIYAGRLHTKRMQDLPFDPGAVLTPEQIDVTRDYCVNDLASTELLLSALAEPLKLRNDMSIEYGQDLRSKSDAQIAEAVIVKRLWEVARIRAKQPDQTFGAHKYQVPAWVHFHTPQFQHMLATVAAADYTVTNTGKVEIPASVTDLHLHLGSSTYNMGNGGLHSSETCAAHIADEHTLIIDRDVASYYPAIILNQGLYPQHLGPQFLDVYRDIVNRRLEAKRSGNKVVAESLKITINGSFGKFGSPYSVLYSPDLMIQVTVTGQLALLMLIERAELAGIPVISGNTDGVVFKCPAALESVLQEVIAGWEADTGFVTEETRYRAIYSANVNNYVALKQDGKHKGKGWFFDPWSSSPPDYRGQLSKNPQTTICVEAVVAYLKRGTPLADTIHACTDVTRFVTVRKVKGGATWRGQYLGKAVRWYYARHTYDCIRTADGGGKVSKSDGARPAMELPATLPDDIDYDWYIREAEEMLVELGAVAGPRRRGDLDERQVDMFAAA